MNFLILDTYYPRFLESLYGENPATAAQPYDRQLRTLMSYAFGTADFYSSNLRRLGHVCEDIVGNCDQLQLQWCRDQRPGLASAFQAEAHLGRLDRWRHAVLTAQVEQYQPDVLYIQDVNWYDALWVASIKRRLGLIVFGQTACELRPDLDCSAYDLVLTSFPHYVSMFRSWGVQSAYVPLAFEPAILDRLGRPPKEHGIAFVGTYATTGAHGVGTRVLERVAEGVPVEFWGPSLDRLDPASPIRHTYRGPAWGLDAYRALAGARIVLNRHSLYAYRYANNMRLYEATGVGSMLLTDAKDNLGELFDVGREVVTYRDADECATLAHYYLEHEDERVQIARAGQARTLRDHTYGDRMRSIIELAEHATASQTSVHPLPRWPVEGLAADGRRMGWSYRPLGRWMVPTYVRARRLTGRLKRVAARGGGRLANRLHRPSESPRDARLRSGSRNYQPVAAHVLDLALAEAWRAAGIPHEQRRLVDSELARMHRGDVVPAFQVAAEAVRATGCMRGTLAEVGAASGYYSEVLRHLVGPDLQYVGVDYSAAMLALARRSYPNASFVLGDARRLGWADSSFDIVLSGCVMLHVPDYIEVVRETARVAKQWCIFHRTPVSSLPKTVCFTKYAYGTQVVEFLFSEQEVFELFHENGLFLRAELLIDQTSATADRPAAMTKTYVCRKIDSPRPCPTS